MPDSSPPLPADTPKVLLFGHSGAGKSSVLGALLKASETEGPTLRGEVLEPSGRLASIRDSIYRGGELSHTDSELTSYTVRLRPWRTGAVAVTDPLTVVIHDCSGKAAEHLIAHPDAIQDSRTAAPVARAVVLADAIMLMVDASSDEDELQEAFEEFDAFLTVIWQAKAGAREVGGFPVLLVLTHCDRLARPGDTLDEWEARVRRRADEAWTKFDRYLKDAEPDDDLESPFLPFGGIDLTVYAVAIRHPKLKDRPAPEDVPFGVAELFHDCFVAAAARRDRATASNRRLKWTVRLSMSLVSLLFLGVMTMALFPPRSADPGLEERITGYRRNEQEAAVRLSYPYLSRNKEALAAFRDAPGFDAVAPELRSFVLSRLKEIEDYEDFRGKLLGSVAPGDTRTLEDLAAVEARLRGELGLPAAYSWGATPAARLRDKWLADAAAIRAAEARFGVGEADPSDPTRVRNKGYYQRLIDEGNDLLITPSLGGSWREKVNALLREGQQPPAPLDAPLAGSPAIDQPRGQALTNFVPYSFQRVTALRRAWQGDVNPATGAKITRGLADELVALRDLGDALGLTAGGDARPLLMVPEPGAGIDPAKFPSQRLFELTTTYPPRQPGYAEWELRHFPGPAKSLAARLDESFRNGAAHVRGLLRDRLGPDAGAKDTPADWKALANTLGDPATPYPDWGRLLSTLARLRTPGAPDPVGTLAELLRRDSFDIDAKGFALLMPRRLRGVEPVVPAGPLVVTVTPASGAPVVRELKPAGDERAGDERVYHFATADGKLVYRPGDALRLELPVRSGTEELKLVWDRSQSRTYQFDAAEREPRMVKGEASEPAPGVRLTPEGGSTWPRLPIMFPHGGK